MKAFVILIIVRLSFIPCMHAQEPINGQQMENLHQLQEQEQEDDTQWQQWETYRRHPLDLNTADEDELLQLRLLTAMQIANFLSYRQMFGKLIDVHELQAVPGWDPAIIRELLPFVTISPAQNMATRLLHRLKEGEHVLIVRVARVMEKAKGFDRTGGGSHYMGSPEKIFMRYKYSYKNLLQFGLTGDKDAGESFFKGAQRAGFDFYSGHFFLRKLGIIHALALGDFSVSMGQGLVHLQGLAFGKGADITNIKRQSPALKPYNSAGEFNFHRGIGITIKRGRIESTFFLSNRKHDASVKDDVAGYRYFSSLQTSGNHRTGTEIDNKNTVGQLATGLVLKYSCKQIQVAANGVFHRFSLPVQKSDEPYQLFALSGNNWFNAGMDYSYTFRQIHLFGEWALDRRLAPAFLQGLLISVDPKVDLSVSWRAIAARYQVLTGDAFIESSRPSNESGVYLGIRIRPHERWRIEAYTDTHRFPWLRYRVDAPSYGWDRLLHLVYAPSRRLEISLRWRDQLTQLNGEMGLEDVGRQAFRFQLNYNISRALMFRHRTELIRMHTAGKQRQDGFLGYAEAIISPPGKSFSLSIRGQYFESASYDSRIYAFESDLLYSYSVPAFFGRGYRYYLLCQKKFGKRFGIWWRVSQTVYPEQHTQGSGLDTIEANQKTEIRAQIRWFF